MEFFKKKGDVQAKKLETKDETIKDKNPYINAREEWLERYGSYIKQAHNWRLTAIITLLIATISIIGNVMQSSQVKVIPYIVEVDNLGRSKVVARADTASVAPERLIQSVVAQVIQDWRTVTADVVLQQNMITRLSYFFAGSAKGILKEWFSKNNPYNVAKSGKLVHVELKSLPLKVGENSYRIEWLETVRNHSGTTLDTQSYEATVIVQLNPPNNEQALIFNPGGVYVTSISTSKVFQNK